MTAVLIVAHGSKRETTVREIAALTDAVRERLAGDTDHVDYAFLQWAEPSIATRVKQLLDEGVTDLTIVPYLLATGSHVANDIPEAVRILQQAHPDLAVHIRPHIGAASGMIDVLCDHSRQ